MNKELRCELEKLINKYSLGKGSDTPDFILTDYLLLCLAVFGKTMDTRRAEWYKGKAEADK